MGHRETTLFRTAQTRLPFPRESGVDRGRGLDLGVRGVDGLLGGFAYAGDQQRDADGHGRDAEHRRNRHGLLVVGRGVVLIRLDASVVG